MCFRRLALLLLLSLALGHLGHAQQCPQGYTLTGGRCVLNGSGVAATAPSGAKAVYLADSATAAIGTAISTYLDSSGNGYNGTAAGSARATVVAGPAGHRAYRFDATAASVTLPAALSVHLNDMTILYVAQQNELVTSAQSVISLTSAENFTLSEGQGPYNQLRAYPAPAVAAYQQAGWAVSGVMANAVDTYVVSGGNLYSSAYVMNSTATHGGFFGSLLGSQWWSNSDVAELRIYDHALTAAEMRQWNTYVAVTYGIGIADTRTKLVGIIGDSIVGGFPGLPTAATTWPNYLANLVPTGYQFVNFGQSGFSAVSAQSNAAVSYYPVCATGRGIAFVAVGTNDLTNLGHSAATTIADLKTLTNGLKAAGCRVYIATIIDRTVDAAFETARATVNTAITTTFVSGGYADFVVDVAADSRFANAASLTYFDADQIHLSTLGYQLMAQLWMDALYADDLRVIYPSPGGRFMFGGNLGSAFQVSPTANQMLYFLFDSPGETLNSLNTLAQAASADHVTACVYNSTGALVPNGQGSTASFTTAPQIYPITFTSLTLPPGQYWMGMASHNDGSTTTIYNDGDIGIWGVTVANAGKSSSTYPLARGPSGANLATGTTTLACPATMGTLTACNTGAGTGTVCAPLATLN